jgi:hypothetical protein
VALVIKSVGQIFPHFREEHEAKNDEDDDHDKNEETVPVKGW